MTSTVREPYVVVTGAMSHVVANTTFGAHALSLLVGGATVARARTLAP